MTNSVIETMNNEQQGRQHMLRFVRQDFCSAVSVLLTVTSDRSSCDAAGFTGVLETSTEPTLLLSPLEAPSLKYVAVSGHDCASTSLIALMLPGAAAAAACLGLK
eukprot:CAMPEP_0115202494 /NCGR_PEP_ID=MMETSP0270-20121206/18162_1 /TAXON_ID=71861 /ORGANISM="Scrippsiella trochoidea, Strain CCMP3099" /LENGTH=104 /DNA_ID=CAMNT_0002615923 /DNA_START=598 /DNA_END=909 /DNA_ORIENTATION=+